MSILILKEKATDLMAPYGFGCGEVGLWLALPLLYSATLSNN